MESIAFWALVVTSAGVLAAGFLRPNGYMQVPFWVAAVYLGWAIPQLWYMRQVYRTSAEDHLATLHIFCLFCLLATIAGWYWGVRSGKGRAIREVVTDDMLVRICVVITIIVCLMTIGIAVRPREEWAGPIWSGPLAIMNFFRELKLVSLFLSLYLVAKRRNTLTIALVVIHIALYVPAAVLLFRRRAMLELFTCTILALWFARRTVMPRVMIAAAIPAGMLVVFAVASLRDMSDAYTTDARWLTLSEVSSVDFWAATPFTNENNASEMTNALRMVRFADDHGVHTYGGATWNRIVHLWVPAQLVGEEGKRNLKVDYELPQRIVDTYNEQNRIGSTPTGMGEAYLEFGFLGALFFAAMGFVTGRWWSRAHRGSRTAMVLYAIGLPLAMHMPAAYAFYFFNSIALSVLVFLILVSRMKQQPARRVYAAKRANRLDGHSSTGSL